MKTDAETIEILGRNAAKRRHRVHVARTRKSQGESKAPPRQVRNSLQEFLLQQIENEEMWRCAWTGEISTADSPSFHNRSRAARQPAGRTSDSNPRAASPSLESGPSTSKGRFDGFTLLEANLRWREKPPANLPPIANITTVKGHVLHGLSPDSMHFTHVLYDKWRLSQKRAGRSMGTLDRMIEIEEQRTREEEARKALNK